LLRHIATIFSGQPVKPGKDPEPVDHYRLLRTLQDMYALTPTAHAADRQPITDVWL
jgi:acid phosphatase